jgi:hypothetical protein|tara:strand:- start:362 stop:538 length:177 start_codon:yes stop_codon:yes gene_type:complete
MKLQPNQILLCCGKGGCPVVTKEKDGSIKIADDYGNEVQMKEAEARLIEGALKQLKDK